MTRSLFILLCCTAGVALAEPARDALRLATDQYGVDGDAARFRARLSGLVTAEPKLAEAHFNLAMLDASAERFDEAIRGFERVVQLAPSSSDLARRAAIELEVTKSLRAAVGTPAAQALRYDTLVEEGRLLAGLGRFASARAKALEATRLMPSRFEAFQVLAAVELAAERPDEAQKALATAIQVAPAAERARLEKARIAAKRAGKIATTVALARKVRAAEGPIMSLKHYATLTSHIGKDAAEEYGGLLLETANVMLAAGYMEPGEDLLKRLAHHPDPAISAAAAAQHRLVEQIERRTRDLEEKREEAERLLAEILAAPQAADRSIGLHAGGVPAALLRTLRKALVEGRRVHDVALSPNGGWLVLGDRNWFESAGIPAPMKTALEASRSAGEVIHSAAFGQDGAWIFLRGANGWSADGIPTDLDTALKKLNSSGETLTGMALGQKGQWFILRGDNGSWRNGLPPAFETEYKKLYAAKEALGRVVLAPGAWLIQRGGNGFSQEAMPAGAVESFGLLRKGDKVAAAVALGPKGSWVVVEQR